MSGFIFFVLFVACVLYMHVVVVQDVCSWCVHVYGECGCMFCIAFACWLKYCLRLKISCYHVFFVCFSISFIMLIVCVLHAYCTWCVLDVCMLFMVGITLIAWLPVCVTVTACVMNAFWCCLCVWVCVCCECVCIVHVCMFMLCACLWHMIDSACVQSCLNSLSLFLCMYVCVFSAEPWQHSHLLTG